MGIPRTYKESRVLFSFKKKNRCTIPLGRSFGESAAYFQEDCKECKDSFKGALSFFFNLCKEIPLLFQGFFKETYRVSYPCLRARLRHVCH